MRIPLFGRRSAEAPSPARPADPEEAAFSEKAALELLVDGTYLFKYHGMPIRSVRRPSEIESLLRCPRRHRDPRLHDCMPAHIPEYIPHGKGFYGTTGMSYVCMRDRCHDGKCYSPAFDVHEV